MTKVKNYQEPQAKKQKAVKTAKISLVFLVSFLALLVIVFCSYSLIYQNKMYFGTELGDRHLAGKSKKEVADLVKEASTGLSSQKLVLQYGDKSYNIEPNELALSYNDQQSADELFNFARSWSMSDMLVRTTTIFKHRKLKPIYSFNEAVLNDKINAIATELDQPEKDYSLKIVSGQVELLSERSSGLRLNKEQIKNDVHTRFDWIDRSTVNLSVTKKEPGVTYENALIAKSEAESILKLGGVNLWYADKNYNVDLETLGSWIVALANGNDLVIDLDRNKIREQIKTIAAGIDVGPQDAMLSFAAGKVSVFQPSRDGVSVDVETTVNKLVAMIIGRISPTDLTIDLTKLAVEVKVTKASITSESISSLGLNDQISTGTTSFTGSPANRVSNITVGARLINGVLIKPGETFSTLARLGKIDATSGFLPELVIKENRTVPEYGGGLCQVSTTLFRAALNAGLEIVERQNHRYRVSYYEPPVGMDATIYEPAPDFKFKNDTAGYILVQSRVVGYKITFEFYGTKDSRTVTISDPVVSDITPPAAPIMEPTDTLPAGEQKQVERAHDGATAVFTYTVMKDGQQLHKNTFRSVYVPWQARILVGTGPVAPAPTPPADPATAPTT